jgi:cellulose synthase/poly-beta-1,6-N-acetylglucosamine synthase-like glycosyltransferase
MWDQAVFAFQSMQHAVSGSAWFDVAMHFFPFALVLELPLFLLVTFGILKYAVRRLRPTAPRRHYPTVSCIITCYSEGEDVRQTIRSLAHQVYPGMIQIIPVIDGAIQNKPTLEAAQRCHADVAGLKGRRLIVLPKWQRGGRVSSLNAGLQLATGEVVMALDGDTSFDNDMVSKATRHFDDPNVVGVAGCLRVRNAAASLAARLQALEYMLSIAAGKTGLSEFNIVNNISGAFGVFRRSFLAVIGGWDAGTAEDLDITTRIKQYFGRHPQLRIAFEPHAVGHTDAPTSFRIFFRQRLRWEGDLFYIYIRKFRHNLRPRLLGWRNFLFVAVNGLLLQMVMPFMIVAYSTFLFWRLPLGSALGLLAYIYCVYFAALAFFFALYLIVVSERPKQDLRYWLYLPLFPLFAFSARVHCAYAMAQELFLNSHLDSSMAPRWVLKKNKF